MKHFPGWRPLKPEEEVKDGYCVVFISRLISRNNEEYRVPGRKMLSHYHEQYRASFWAGSNWWPYAPVEGPASPKRLQLNAVFSEPLPLP